MAHDRVIGRGSVVFPNVDIRGIRIDHSRGRRFVIANRTLQSHAQQFRVKNEFGDLIDDMRRARNPVVLREKLSDADEKP